MSIKRITARNNVPNVLHYRVALSYGDRTYRSQLAKGEVNPQWGQEAKGESFVFGVRANSADNDILVRAYNGNCELGRAHVRIDEGRDGWFDLLTEDGDSNKKRVGSSVRLLVAQHKEKGGEYSWDIKYTSDGRIEAGVMAGRMQLVAHEWQHSFYANGKATEDKGKAVYTRYAEPEARFGVAFDAGTLVRMDCLGRSGDCPIYLPWGTPGVIQLQNDEHCGREGTIIQHFPMRINFDDGGTSGFLDDCVPTTAMYRLPEDRGA
jgi:hypothetical protein